MWERWEKLGGLGMNSHNHIMFGSIDAWFYRTLAGIVPTSPGGATVRVQPWAVGDLTHAGADYLSMHGPLSVRWDRSEQRFHLLLELPLGVTADVRIPLRNGRGTLTESGITAWQEGKSVKTVDGVSAVRPEGSFLAFQALCGSYDFELRG